MKALGAALAGMAALAFAVRIPGMDGPVVIVLLLAGAFAAYRSASGSLFLKIPVAVFGCETVALGLFSFGSTLGIRPAFLPDADVTEPVMMTLPILMAFLVALETQSVVARALAIADRYFHMDLYYRIPLPGGRIWRLHEGAVGILVVALGIFATQVQAVLGLYTLFASAKLADAIQTFDADAFWNALLVQIPLWWGLSQLVNLASRTISELFVLRWRQGLSQDYVRRWLATDAHFRMALMARGIDNPDQRIHEDIPMFINGGAGAFGIYSFVQGLTGMFSSFLTYAMLLWTISETVTLFGLQVPGLLVWIALLWGAFTTVVTFLIGKPLVSLTFRQQKYEADYRFALTRTREYNEQIALSSGGRTEASTAERLFRPILRNNIALVVMTAILNFLSTLVATFGQNLHYITLGSLFLARQATLGTLTQVASGFAGVGSVFGFFGESFVALASFKAILDRLTGFDLALDRADMPPEGHRTEGTGSDIVLSDVVVRLPDGKVLSKPLSVTFRAGENTLITGPSGTGKSTLLRVLADVWPCWSGSIVVPQDASLLVLPQKPYLPIGALRAAISYPRGADSFTDAPILEALEDVGLGHLTHDLDTDENWPQRLSGGEQQRLAIARAILNRPDWLLLDEATAALDPKFEQRVYEALKRHLPETTILSIGHRESLAAFHARRLDVQPDGADGFILTPHRPDRTKTSPVEHDGGNSGLSLLPGGT